MVDLARPARISYVDEAQPVGEPCGRDLVSYWQILFRVWVSSFPTISLPVAIAVGLSGARKKSDELTIAIVPAGTSFPAV
jgi:hypothetical protein